MSMILFGSALITVTAGMVFYVVWREHFAGLPQLKRRDRRSWAAAFTFGCVVCGGVVLGWLGERLSEPSVMATWNPASDPRRDPAGHVKTQRTREIEQRFQQGVVMLHARKYEYAVTAFHRVLELAPQMPEAHVNMGFALLGLERHAAGRDFFRSAIELRPRQLNAYYGLAVALEALGDRAGALGAMRTYVHLSQPEDPYLRKAQAALWEWESALAQERGAAGGSKPAQPR